MAIEIIALIFAGISALASIFGMIAFFQLRANKKQDKFKIREEDALYTFLLGNAQHGRPHF